MPNMSILLSEYPRISVPSLDAITNGPIRAAVAERLRVDAEVRSAHNVNSAVRSGQPVPADMSSEDLAAAILVSGEADARIGASVAAYHGALAEHRDAWREDVAKRRVKDRAAAVKAVKAALAALAEYEITSGTLNMIDVGTPQLQWKAPAEEVFVIHAATQPLHDVLGKLSAEDDQ